MSNLLTKEELLELGFSSVGENVVVSPDARFFAINGSLGDNVRIDAFAILTGNITLGNNVHISPFCFLGGTGGKIEMANRSGLSTHVSIFTKSDDYTTTNKGADKVSGDVIIGEGSIIGSGSKIMPGVTIGEEVRAGCNTVLSKDVESGSIIVSRGIGIVTLASK